MTGLLLDAAWKAAVSKLVPGPGLVGGVLAADAALPGDVKAAVPVLPGVVGEAVDLVGGGRPPDPDLDAAAIGEAKGCTGVEVEDVKGESVGGTMMGGAALLQPPAPAAAFERIPDIVVLPNSAWLSVVLVLVSGCTTFPVWKPAAPVTTCVCWVLGFCGQSGPPSLVGGLDPCSSWITHPPGTSSGLLPRVVGLLPWTS